MKRFVFLTVAGVASIATAQAPRGRDSAGVRIIENGPRLTAPIAFQLGGKPIFDVGGLQQNPDDELSDRNGYPKAIRIKNGNVVILDRTRVLFFAAGGKRIKSFGRAGQGPGEFDPAQAICATRGDTLLVGQGRKPVTRLTRDGELVSIFPPPEGTLTEGDFCFDDGSFVVMNLASRSAELGAVYRFTRANPTGAMNTLVDYRYPVFDPLVRVISSKAARGSRMYFANGDVFEIKAYDKSGRLAEIIRTGDPLVRMTDADKEKMPEMPFRMGASSAERAEARRAAIAKSPTKFWPTGGDMFVDMSGRIWLQDYQPREDPTKPQGWTAFDSTGRLLGRMIIPASPSLAERRLLVHFGKDEVFFNRMDSDGAIHYTAYPILPVRR